MQRALAESFGDEHQPVHEEWRAVPGAPGYEVSSQGRVRSWKPAPLRPYYFRLTPHWTGYVRVCLRIAGQTVQTGVHQMVLRAFEGECPEGLAVRHLDGNKLNNTLSNLQYGTPSENQRDQLVHGTHNFGSRSHCNQGHPLAGENLAFRSDGTRRCRECTRVNCRLWRERHHADALKVGGAA